MDLEVIGRIGATLYLYNHSRRLFITALLYVDNGYLNLDEEQIIDEFSDMHFLDLAVYGCDMLIHPQGNEPKPITDADKRVYEKALVQLKELYPQLREHRNEENQQS